MSSHGIAGVHHAVIVAPVPSRIIWSMTLPHRGGFRAFVATVHNSTETSAGPVRVRVGVSDDRIYEGLTEVVLIPGDVRWREIRADLSAYAGWKWSLFYHPDRITWRLVLSSDSMGSAPGTVMWGSPQIVTDSESAIEYASRR